MKIVINPGRRNERGLRVRSIQFVRTHPGGWPMWMRLIPYIGAAALWLYLWCDKFAG